jgi:IS5 family transposase
MPDSPSATPLAYCPSTVRRLAGIPLAEGVPDHSSIWRFREELAKRGLAERLLAEVNRQLDARGLVLRRGTLIDATILDAAVRPPGGDAGEVAERDPQVVGAARGDEPRPAVAGPGPKRRGARASRTGVRLVHRGLRHAVPT